jgi:hypothetical protein
MAAASRKILLPLPPRKNKQLTETIPATDNTQISIANITKLQLDIRQHEQKISEMKDNLILLLQEHLMSKFTHHSQPQAASDPFSTASPPQLNSFPASGHISQPLVASFSTVPPLQLNAFGVWAHFAIARCILLDRTATAAQCCILRICRALRIARLQQVGGHIYATAAT